MEKTTEYSEGSVRTSETESLREKRMLEILAGGSFIEMAGGIGAVVLAILGLVGIVPPLMAAIATISIGAAILVEGVSISLEYNRLYHKIAADSEFHSAELTGGISAAVFGGAAAIILGILSILTIYPTVLLPISAIILGFGIIFGTGYKARLQALKVCEPESPLFEKIARNAVLTSIGTDLLVGAGAAILGILALVGLYPFVLTLVAFLSLGGTVMIGGSALGSRMISQTKCLRTT